MAYDRTASLFRLARSWRIIVNSRDITRSAVPIYEGSCIARSPRSPGRRLVEGFSMASHWHASQLIVLALGLSGAIACKSSNVYYSAAHGKILVQSMASYASDQLGFLFQKISRSRFHLDGEKSAAKSMQHAGRKLFEDRHCQLYAFG